MRSTLTILLLTCFMFSNALKLKETSKLRDYYYTGQILRSGKELVTEKYRQDYLQSPNNLFRLYIQLDGNLVLFNVAQRTNPIALWSSKTNNKGFNLPIRLTLQPDGNLVLYDRDDRVMWASGTQINNNNNAHFLQLQDDGNLVLYNNEKDRKPEWSTVTFGGRKNL